MFQELLHDHKQKIIGNNMTTSLEKFDKIILIITERFGIEHIDLFVKKIDVKQELRKRLSEIDDQSLDELISDIKKVVNEK
jgi:hypothetical protein